MLRTNSKKAIEGIKNYIMTHYERPEDLGYEGHVLPEKPEFCDIAQYIHSVFKEEYKYSIPHYPTEQAAFREWLCGLPSSIDPAYIYRCSAIDTLGDILEETKEERNRYTEADAENMLSYLIYRTIKREV